MNDSAQNRRTHPRFSHKALVTASRSGETFLFSLENLSRGGCAFFAPNLKQRPWFEKGQFLGIVIFNENQDENIQFTGEVVWSGTTPIVRSCGFGVAIRGIDDRNLIKLRKLIERFDPPDEARATTPLGTLR